MLQQAAQSPINELMQAKVIRATLSERQLEEVLVDFWFNHFNVFVGKGQVRQYLTEYERDAIRPYVLGNFRTLLGATAHSPAMLFYLDNFQSRTANSSPNGRGRGNQPAIDQLMRNRRVTNPAQQRQIEQRLQQMQEQQKRPQGGLNENYARELMELHTLGVDGGYTQQDVIAVAKILTGWTIDRPQQGGGFVFRPQMHEPGSKIVMEKKFSEDGEKEGEKLLDMLATHPSTAKHISFKLVQRFVADEPPAALVDRAAKKFLETKGDLREVTRLIITSPEFFDQQVLLGESEDASRIRRLGRPRDQREHRERDAGRAGASRSRDAALRRAAADRLQHDGRCVDQYRRAAQSHELRRAAPERRHAATRSRPGTWRSGKSSEPSRRTRPASRRTGPDRVNAARVRVHARCSIRADGPRPDSGRRPFAGAGHQRSHDRSGRRLDARR